MVKLLRTIIFGYSSKLLFMAFLVSSVIGVLSTQQVLAGGPILVGYSAVREGKDRVTGSLYPPRLLNGTQMSDREWVIHKRINNSDPDIIYVYPGDEVRFLGVVRNIDPFLIPGWSNLNMHYIGFNDSYHPLRLREYKNRNLLMDESTIDAGLEENRGKQGYDGSSKIVLTVGTGVGVVPGVSNWILEPSKVKMIGPGSTKPGNRYCQFVSTRPTFFLGVVPLLFHVDWKFPAGESILFGGSNFELDDNNQNNFIQLDLGLGTMSCAEIAYVYSLLPSISLTGEVTPDGGAKVNASMSQYRPEIPSDAPSTTESKKTQWQVSRFYLPIDRELGDPESNFTTNDKRPCEFFKDYYRTANFRLNCDIAKYENGRLAQSAGNQLGIKNTVFDKNGLWKSGTKLPDQNSDSLRVDAPDGFKVCYALSVSKYKPYLRIGDEGWRHSKVVCTAGSKKPKIQVLGDDVRVGGKISTSKSTVTELQYGSWGQYASFSAGVNLDGLFATASGFKTPRNFTDNAPTWNALTFANTTGPGSAIGTLYGNFTANADGIASRGAKDLKSFFGDISGNPGINSTSVDLTSIASSKKAYNVTTDITITGGDIAPGKTLILISDRKVTIAGDIRYSSSSLTSINDIPQVVIIAKNIYINPDVERIDAWLIADRGSGIIDTCSGKPVGGQNLTWDVCDKPLRVNGPVVANKLKLKRTHGASGDEPGKPAEIFNNNGLSYLWAYNHTRNEERLISTKAKELPPRY